MIIIGLTGSIGTGKSKTAGMFREIGIPVNDADQVVHALYEGEAVPLIETAFPGSTRNGRVDRTKLSLQLAERPESFKRLEALVHPLVQAREVEFIDRNRIAGTDIVVLDIPLLYETGGSDRVDLVVVVTCSPAVQRQRVLARPNMTKEKFELILSRQLDDAEKRRRADYIVDTENGFDSARQQVRLLVDDIRTKFKLRESPNA